MMKLERLREELKEIYLQMDKIDQDYREIADFEKRPLMARRNELISTMRATMAKGE